MKKEDIDKLILRSRYELPFPMNYLYLDYPGLACIIMLLRDRRTL